MFKTRVGEGFSESFKFRSIYFYGIVNRGLRVIPRPRIERLYAYRGQLSYTQIAFQLIPPELRRRLMEI
jgi:hypothetical protein